MEVMTAKEEIKGLHQLGLDTGRKPAVASLHQDDEKIALKSENLEAEDGNLLPEKGRRQC